MSQSERTERLLNLLFVLMSSTRPVSKATLRRALADYAGSASDAAFERMFERDKEELRSMGVPIETVAGDQGAGGIDGYRVRGDEYALPELTFTAEELAVLAVAAQVWERASLGAAARGALRKLEASGGRARTDQVGVAARVSTPEPSFPAFLAAAQARRPVTFAYRKPGDPTAQTRRLEPWGVLSRGGHWYVVGRDRDRDGTRVFRLSRVLGAVRADAGARDGAYEVPAGAVAAARVSIPAAGTRTPALLRVAAGRAASLRRGADSTGPDPDHPGWDRLTVEYTDDETFADELVGHGAEVVALAPPELREAVVRRLTTAAGVTRA
jgi:proteasome accessory factor B